MTPTVKVIIDHETGVRTTFDSTPDPRLHAVMELDRLEDPRHARLLPALAADPVLGASRLPATKALAELDPGRSHDLLAALAADPSLHDDSRFEAAKTLADLGDRRGRDLLAVLAADPSLSAYNRAHAAKKLPNSVTAAAVACSRPWRQTQLRPAGPNTSYSRYSAFSCPCLTGSFFEALALWDDHILWILSRRDARFEDAESLQRAARQ